MDSSYTFPSLASSSSTTVNISSIPMSEPSSLRSPHSRSSSASAVNRPSLPSRSSSSSAFDESKGRQRSSTLFSIGDVHSFPSSSTIRSSQHSNSTFDPLDSQIVYASLSNTRGPSTPAVVLALPTSASTRTLLLTDRQSSLAPSSSTRPPTSFPARRTSLPSSPYFRPSNAQPSAPSSIKEGQAYLPPLASSSSTKKLPRSSSSRRSLSSLLGSIFTSSSSSSNLAAAARKPEGFPSDSWEHQVACSVIEAGQGRAGGGGDASLSKRFLRGTGWSKPLPVLRDEEEMEFTVTGAERESYHHPAAGYFDQDGEQTETEATPRLSFASRSTNETWELDVDLGGQGLGIAHLFDDENLQTTYEALSALPPSLDSDDDRTSARQRGRTHSSADSSSTGFSSLPPVTPRLRSSSPHNALPRPKATFFPVPIDIDVPPPHLPDIPPSSPLDVSLFPIATPPKDALLDLSPRRRSLRPPGIAAPVAVNQDQDLPQMPFVKAEEFFSLGGDGGGDERERKMRARVSSCGTFGQKKRSSQWDGQGGMEVDLASESELEELASDDGSSLYSQESTIHPLNVKPRPASTQTIANSTTTETLLSSRSSSSPHAPSFTLGPAISRGSASSFASSSSSSSPPPSPIRPPRNPAREAVALATKPGFW
ncbi:hypothetical protein BDY24DRAFT_399735 [Mrakia frigida]|uniref:uncharacterized protein n=1 Tax=Mrakia frigida TaxID=29902 RepID=UPI003FCC11E1